jgi:hypothetical protein
VGPEPLASGIAQFYQTDAISRASKVMAKCVRARQAPVHGPHAASAGN